MVMLNSALVYVPPDAAVSSSLAVSLWVALAAAVHKLQYPRVCSDFEEKGRSFLYSVTILSSFYKSSLSLSMCADSTLCIPLLYHCHYYFYPIDGAVCSNAIAKNKWRVSVCVYVFNTMEQENPLLSFSLPPHHLHLEHNKLEEKGATRAKNS